MKKSVLPYLMGVLIVSLLFTPGEIVFAQVVSFPAEMNKSFSPISMAAGGTSRLNVSIFNPNAFPLTNASWTDNLIGVQPGLTIANPVNVANSCGGTVTAAAGTTMLSLSGGTVPAQTGTTPGACTVSINVTSSTTGNLINTIPKGALTSSGSGTTITNTAPASATLNVIGTLPPAVIKSFARATIWAGEVTQLSIVIRNNETSRSLTQVSLTDTLPANVFLANPVVPTLTGCGAASLTAASGGNSVTLSNGTIAPSSTCTLTVNVTSTVQGAYTNTIPANALKTQQGLTNSSQATARLNVQQIGILKRFSSSTLPVGGTTTLTITLQNPTSSPYTGVSVSDNLPTPLIVAGAATTTCGGSVSTTPNQVSLSGGTIPTGSPATPGTCTISVPVTVPAGTPAGTLTNTIPNNALTTNQGVGNLRGASASVTVTSTQMSGIKSFSPSTIDVGGNSRLRIDIFAPDDTNLTNFALTDDLPAGIAVSNSTPPAMTGCGPTPPLALTAPTGASSISVAGGLILAGQRCRIDVYVTGSTLGQHTNTIPPTKITNAENRTLTGDLTSSLNVVGGTNLSIALVKGFDPLTVFGGSASTLSVKLINMSNVPLSGIGFSDNMPNGMILANPVNFNVGTCGGALSGAAGDNSFSFSGGNLAVGGECTLTLSATMTVNGNLTNTIPSGAVVTTEGGINVDPAQATLTNLPGASLSKFFTPKSIVAGASSALTITIQNTGNIGLTGMGFSDSLPSGLTIAGGSEPAPVNNCGGNLTAVSGTQLIQLGNGALAGNSSCTIVVSITGNKAGDFQNTIVAGTLTTDQGITNNIPSSDHLVITGKSNGGGTKKKKTTTPTSSTTSSTSPFLIPVTGFAPNVVTKLNASAQPSYAATSLTLAIPVLKLNVPIVGVQSKAGTWDVSWLQEEVGWLNGTAYPTWSGNSVLTAHVVNADGKPGVFYRLKSLGVGEYIFLYGNGYRYTYKVVSNSLVQPDDASVMQHEDKSFLTLITCDGYDLASGTYLHRAVIGASLIDVHPMR